MVLNTSSQKIIKVLLPIVLVLTVLSVVGQLYKYSFGHDRYLVTLTNLDAEWNLPTWYQSNTLLLCSLLLGIISYAKKTYGSRFHLHWLSLSVIFLILAMDESIQFHEQTITPLRTLLRTSGIFYFAWVIPAAILLLILGLAFMKFLQNLPGKTRRLFLISGSIYVGGVIGMELVGGSYFSSHGKDNLTYAMLANLEEFLEMSGILIFIYALMRYIKENLKDLKLCLANRDFRPSTDLEKKYNPSTHSYHGSTIHQKVY